jgi:lysophospholipid acyltransferase (LPLAT)-like uncharacterized protein
MKSKKVIIACVAIIFLILLTYSYVSKQQVRKDLEGDNGVVVQGVITGIWHERVATVVDVKYSFRNQVTSSYYTTYSTDSIRIGSKVKLVISKLHPAEGIGYVGVIKK